MTPGAPPDEWEVPEEWLTPECRDAPVNDTASRRWAMRWLWVMELALWLFFVAFVWFGGWF